MEAPGMTRSSSPPFGPRGNPASYAGRSQATLGFEHTRLVGRDLTLAR